MILNPPAVQSEVDITENDDEGKLEARKNAEEMFQRPIWSQKSENGSYKDRSCRQEN